MIGKDRLATTETEYDTGQGTVPEIASDIGLCPSLRTALSKAAAEILALALLCSQGCSAVVVPPKSVPWEWTVEERLAARFDPQGAAERRTKEATEPYGFRNVEANPPGVNVVIGKRNPELLLPWEIFSYLIDTAYASDHEQSDQFRRALEGRGTLPEGLWNNLASCLTRYLAERDAEDALFPRNNRTPNQSDRMQIHELHRRRCASRQLALECARRQFGDNVFDRFLYESIAPKVFRFWDGDALSLRFIEGGCK